MSLFYEKTLVEVFKEIHATEIKGCPDIFCPETKTFMNIANNKVVKYVETHVHDECERRNIKIDIKNVVVLYCPDCDKYFFTKDKKILKKYI